MAGLLVLDLCGLKFMKTTSLQPQTTAKNVTRLSALALVLALSLVTAGQAIAQRVPDGLTTQALLQTDVESVTEKHSDITVAIAAFGDQRLEQMRNSLAAARTADPTLPAVEILEARMWLAANQPARARQRLEQRAATADDDAEPLLYFAEQAAREQRVIEAQLLVRQAKQILTESSASLSEFKAGQLNARAAIVTAGLAEARADWEAVIAELQPILKTKNVGPGIHRRFGQALFQTGQADEALKSLRENYDPQEPGAQLPEMTMGLLYAKADNQAQAVELMRTAAEKQDQDAEIQMTIARWSLGRGYLELAEQSAERARQASNNSLSSRLVRATVARYQQDSSLAKSLLEAIHLDSPTNVAVMLELAITLSRVPQTRDAAIEYGQLATNLLPDLNEAGGRNAAIVLAWTLQQAGRAAKAQEIVEKVVGTGALNAECQYFAAAILQNSRNRDAAKALLRQALGQENFFPDRAAAEALLESMEQ